MNIYELCMYVYFNGADPNFIPFFVWHNMRLLLEQMRQPSVHLAKLLIEKEWQRGL